MFIMTQALKQLFRIAELKWVSLKNWSKKLHIRPIILKWVVKLRG
jgi:hypothetical protein